MIKYWIYIFYVILLILGYVRGGFDNQLTRNPLNNYLMFNQKYLCPEILGTNAGQVICNDLLLDDYVKFVTDQCPPDTDFVERSFNCPDADTFKLKDCQTDSDRCTQNSQCVKVVCSSTTPTLKLDINSILGFGSNKYVCDSTSTFGDFEALVVCKTLGFNNFSTYKKTTCPGSIVFSIKNLQCKAADSSFPQCSYSENLQGCTPNSCLQIYCSNGEEDEGISKQKGLLILVLVMVITCLLFMIGAILCYYKRCKDKQNATKYIDNEQAKELSSQNQLQNVSSLASPHNQHHSQQQLRAQNQPLSQESASGSQLTSVMNHNQIFPNLNQLNYPVGLQNASAVSNLHGLPVIPAFQPNPNFQGLQVGSNLQNPPNSQGVSNPQALQNFQDPKNQQVNSNLQEPQNLQIIQAHQNLQGLAGLQGVQNFQMLPNLQNVSNLQNIQNLQNVSNLQNASNFQGLQNLQLLQYLQMQNQHGIPNMYPQNQAFFLNLQQQPQSLNQSSLPLQQQNSLENQGQINLHDNAQQNLELNDIKFPAQENNINIENPNGELQQQQIIQQKEHQEQLEKDDLDNKKVEQYNYPPVENVKPRDYQVGLNYNQLL